MKSAQLVLLLISASLAGGCDGKDKPQQVATQDARVTTQRFEHLPEFIAEANKPEAGRGRVTVLVVEDGRKLVEQRAPAASEMKSATRIQLIPFQDGDREFLLQVTWTKKDLSGGQTLVYATDIGHPTRVVP